VVNFYLFYLAAFALLPLRIFFNLVVTLPDSSFFKFPEQLFLFFVQIRGGFNDRLNDLVAASAGSERRDALASEAE